MQGICLLWAGLFGICCGGTAFALGMFYSACRKPRPRVWKPLEKGSLPAETLRRKEEKNALLAVLEAVERYDGGKGE